MTYDTHARYAVSHAGPWLFTFATIRHVYTYARAALKPGEVLDVERIEEDGAYLVFTLRMVDGVLRRSDV